MARLSGSMLGIGLAACTVGPDYQSPEIAAAPIQTAPETVDVPNRTVEGKIDTTWWKSFRDSKLSSLVERLAAQNLDLKTAAERVIQSVAQRQVAVAQGLPHIDGQSSSTYNRVSPNGPISEFVPAPGSTLDYAHFQDGLTSSWQLDLFGRVRRAVEAADANTLATVENRHGVALAALAELAQSYMQLRGTQNRLEIAKRNLRLADENVELVNTRFGGGVATTLDLAQARAQQATIAATLPPLRIQEAELINAIGLLLGDAPRALETELHRFRMLPRVPRRVPVGLPGALVRRRPDVREAEAHLHEATAQTGVAVASFYPDVTLNGAVSLESLHLSNLFSPTSTAFAVGPSISIPIFEGGRLRGVLTLRESQQREAAIFFQKTVLRAWKEVDDAMTAYREAQHRRADVARSVTENHAALQAARQRYSEGAIDFLNVIATQAQLLQSEIDLADSDTRIATDLVNLYRALGGGWEVGDVAYSADSAPRQTTGTP
ncbi:efflux transporter outer membrane subunit [Bradyrhizobium erythrophlei]|jgi:NodT family efflux transporter outer membrane factor (OMF) lipoprotein|uniref:Efflux transporter, outer membrane factor (OMF) lipoprotein, NodT family n=1 Tax=Bradyrhizobium erythrophlei TaxID=1437360 RepID=A0A1M5SMH5_9BRAD|nr:efflux transporter outer membrane subunit [Bradyrhizobium erythrophlei]SHH39704.1 efflux transporter, outer membrane factor (OMF) lipoprotein, NodT family [Bradyrhizobium erythrophlei]